MVQNDQIKWELVVSLPPLAETCPMKLPTEKKESCQLWKLMVIWHDLSRCHLLCSRLVLRKYKAILTFHGYLWSFLLFNKQLSFFECESRSNVNLFGKTIVEFFSRLVLKYLYEHITQWCQGKVHTEFNQRIIVKQVSFPVGCVLTVCQLYMFQWPLPDVSIRWGGGGRSSREQVWTGLQWWSPNVRAGGGGRSLGLMSRGEAVGPLVWYWWGGMWHIPWCMGCTYTPILWTDRHLWKHYLPVTSFAGGNY